jgi:hypothetical protein
VPDKIIMAVIGWKTRAMLDRYNIVTAADLNVFLGRWRRGRRPGPRV